MLGDRSMKENKQINKSGLTIISSKELWVKLWAYEIINKQADQKPVKFLTKLYYRANYNPGFKKKLVINKESSSPPQLATGRNKQGGNTPQRPHQLCSDKGWWAKRTLPENGVGLSEEWKRVPPWEQNWGSSRDFPTAGQDFAQWTSVCCVFHSSFLWRVAFTVHMLPLFHHLNWVEKRKGADHGSFGSLLTRSQSATHRVNCSNSRNLGWMHGEKKWRWLEYKKGVHRLQGTSRGQTGSKT